MKKILLLAFVSGLFLTACNSTPSTPAGGEHATEADHATAGDFLGKEPMDSMSFATPVNFGPKKVTEAGAIASTDLPARLGTSDSLTNMKVRGPINACCQNKGCWLTMQLADGKDMRVKFRDYAFFVPKNSAGNEIVVEGTAYRELISVEDQRHYARDHGDSDAEIAKITEPVEEITFMADGALVIGTK
jgi:hypothetical protein